VVDCRNEIADVEQIISDVLMKLKEAVVRFEMLDEPFESAKSREYKSRGRC
jgi:hypothetical protein